MVTNDQSEDTADPTVNPITDTKNEVTQLNTPKKHPKKLILVVILVLITIFIAIVYTLRSNIISLIAPQKASFNLSSSVKSVNGLENAKVRAVFTNGSKEADLNSCVNDPTYHVNKKIVSPLFGCLDVVQTEPETIPAYERKQWSYTIYAYQIKAGRSEVYANWDKYKSNTIIINKSVSEKEKTQIDKCPTLQKIHEYCQPTLIERYSTVSANELKEHLRSVGITPLVLQNDGESFDDGPVFVQLPPDNDSPWLYRIYSKKSLVLSILEDDSIFRQKK